MNAKRDYAIRCDLHTHSVFSDGTFTPEEIIKLAKESDIHAVALCDHNTVDGLESFVAAAEKYSIEAAGGVEFSTEFCEKELHVIAMFVQPKDHCKIKRITEDYNKRKENSNIELIDRLCENGYDISYEQLKSKHKGIINRAHIGAALTEKGYTASIDEAFKTVLSEKRGFYKPAKKPETLEIIKFISSIKAVSILAHPFLEMTADEIEEFLPKAKQCGLEAMETIYPLYSAETEKEAALLAKKFDLLESGGSDFHGKNKPSIMLGTGKGNMEVPFSFYEKLKERKIELSGESEA